MKKLLFLLFITSIALSCNKKTTGSSTSTNGKNSVSAVYKNFEDLEARLEKEKNDGNTHVVVFWATWCVQCRKELPHVEDLNKMYKDKGVEVLLVNLDESGRINTRVKPFIKKHGLQSEVVAMTDPDQGKWIEKLDRRWTGALPATIIFKGEKRKFFQRPLLLLEMENVIKNM